MVAFLIIASMLFVASIVFTINASALASSTFQLKNSVNDFRIEHQNNSDYLYIVELWEKKDKNLYNLTYRMGDYSGRPAFPTIDGKYLGDAFHCSREDFDVWLYVNRADLRYIAGYLRSGKGENHNWSGI